MKRDKPNSYLPRFLIGLAITSIIIIAGTMLSNAISFSVMTHRLFVPLIRLLALVSFGLVVGQVIEASGWTRQLAVVARPLFRFGNLGPRCGAAFTTAFFSGTAANAMLYDFFQNRTITRKQLFLSNFINQMPAYFLHLPTTMFIVLPLTGIAGAYYFLLTFLAVLLRTGAFLLFGRWFLPAQENPKETISSRKKENKKTKKEILGQVKKKFPKRFLGVAAFVIPIYSLVFVLNRMGLFTVMRDWLASFVVTRVVPVESLSVVILSFVAEFSSGFAAAGALLDAGVLTVKQTVIALLIGNVTAFPVRALRHQLPRYLGIFSPAMGGQILLMGQSFRVSSIILVGFVFYLVM